MSTGFGWWADGYVTGYDAVSGTPSPTEIVLASPGSVDARAITRRQYNIPTHDTAADNTTDAQAFITVGPSNIATWPVGTRFTATMFVLDSSVFTDRSYVPTPTEILSQGSQCRAYRSSTYTTTTGDKTFNITGFTALTPNTKYWVLVIPTAVSSANWSSPPSVATDKPMAPTSVDLTGRAVSVLMNNTPTQPLITSPPTGILKNPGETFTFSFELPSYDPDAISGGSGPRYTDIAGVQVQYRAVPTEDAPNPTWIGLPIANSTATEVDDGWYIDGCASVPASSGAALLWASGSMTVDCGTDMLTANHAILPSGDWELRCRLFDYGHPYPASIKPLARPSGNYTATNYPSVNTSPWVFYTTRVTVSAQVPPPIPLSPSNALAISEGTPVTLTYQYRNTHSPPRTQASRTIQIRRVGSAVWTTLTTTGTGQTLLVTGFPLTSTQEYEWRVQVTDTDDEVSNWSSIARFWVVAAPQSGGVQPLPSETIDGATLGCGKHRAFIYRRGGAARVGEISGISHLDWGRKRDDISTAQVVVSSWDIDCGNILAKLQTWAYELVIFRDNGYSVDRVWEGPITLITYERDKVTIDAKDVMAYAYRRVIRQDMNDAADGDTVTNRAVRIMQNCFAPDDPNILAYLTPIIKSDDAREHRSIPGFTRTAFEEIDDMAANAGLDYTAVGRSVILWDTSHRIGTLPEFRDSDLGSSPVVSEYGMSMSNFYSTGDGMGHHGDAVRGGVEVEGDEVSRNDDTYGLVEILGNQWASDSSPVEGTYTSDQLNKLIQGLEDSSERAISNRYPPPVVVRVPDNTSLNPDAVVSIQQLVPGVAIPLRSNQTLREVRATQKLDSIKVVEEAEKETISVTMSPFSTDDAGTGTEEDI